MFDLNVIRLPKISGGYKGVYRMWGNVIIIKSYYIYMWEWILGIFGILKGIREGWNFLLS